MSDTSGGDGWWLASDGKWYPPEQAPGAAPPPPPQAVETAPAPTKGGGLAVAALVLGIIGVLFGLIPLTFFMAWVLGVLALIFGLVGRGKARARRTMATWGAVLGAVAIALGVLGVIIIDDAVDELDEIFNDDVVDEGDVDLNLETCTVDEVGDLEATGTITNLTSDTQGFEVEAFFFDDNDVRITESSTFVESLGPDETAQWRVVTFEEPQGEFRCEIQARYSIFD